MIASDRASSENVAMPQATITRDAAVDHVAPLDDITGRLVELVGGRALPA